MFPMDKLLFPCCLEKFAMSRNVVTCNKAAVHSLSMFARHSITHHIKKAAYYGAEDHQAESVEHD